jgi:hypothetical protein
LLPAGSSTEGTALTALADGVEADAILDVRLTVDTRLEPP